MLDVFSQPNCETRKWNVLGEIRVGIFAKQDISVGTELAYDYNFEWYGGAKVRCLCLFGISWGQISWFSGNSLFDNLSCESPFSRMKGESLSVSLTTASL